MWFLVWCVLFWLCYPRKIWTVSYEGKEARTGTSVFKDIGSNQAISYQTGNETICKHKKILFEIRTADPFPAISARSETGYGIW